MDATRCVKLAKDCGLLDKNLTKNDIDLTFQKAKEKGQRKITFKQFLVCLNLWAARKNMPLAALVEFIVTKAPETPRFNGATKAEYARWHDDESTYTGVYKRGGPAVYTESAKVSLDNLLDRSPADIRGRKMSDVEVEGKLKELSISSSQAVDEDKLDTTVVELIPGPSEVAADGTMLHPDWKEIKNPEATGKHDQVYYVNRHTLETSWKRPTVSAKPPPLPALDFNEISG